MTEADSPSGRESEIRELIKEEAERLGYEVYEDTLGSVIAHKKGNGKKVMFDAHMDEIGIVATYSDKNGFIRFGAVGGLTVKELVHRRVRFADGTVGVIGSEEESFNEKADIAKLYVDAGGIKSKNTIKTGDTAVFVGEFYQNGDTVVSKALDNRAGCYILLKAMAEIGESENDLYFAFTVQEEVGLRGAKTAAFGIMPDYAIAVDVTDTGDTPSCPVMDVKLGKGAAVKIMDHSVMCDVNVINTLKSLAEEKRIPYQNEIMTDGGTDAGAIALTGAGVRAGGISLPVRYIHSPSEMADCGDIRACIELVKAGCEYAW